MPTNEFNIDFIFVGPQRTGTTWVYEQLLTHPKICFPKDVKETMFFDRYYEKGMEWYAWHFQHAKSRQILGEVAPTYFHSIQAAERICKLNPECKIFITYRNPVERAVSLYHHHYRKGRVGNSFSEAVATMPEIIESGKYSKLVPKWKEIFGDENIYFILMSEIKSNPEGVLKNLCKHLSISIIASSVINSEKVNSRSAPTNLFIAKKAAKLSTFLRSIRMHKLVAWGKRIGMQSVFTGGNKKLLPKITGTERKNLQREYHEDITYMEALLGEKI